MITMFYEIINAFREGKFAPPTCLPGKVVTERDAARSLATKRVYQPPGCPNMEGYVLSKKSEPALPNNFGPRAMLQSLISRGRGNGVLANAIRDELANPRKSSNGIVIGATLRRPEDDNF